MAAMLSRLAYPRRCRCYDCGDPARTRRYHRQMKRSARLREKRQTRREAEEQ